MAKRQQPKLKKCDIEPCWEMIPEGRALCPACTSWWHRIQIKSADELGRYMKRLGRFSGRYDRISGLTRVKRGASILDFPKRKSA
jgi:hypothetical protein